MLKKIFHKGKAYIKHRLADLTISLRYSGKPIFFLGTYLEKPEGNALYFSLYAKDRKDIFFFVSCFDKDECKRLRSKGINAVERRSLLEYVLIKKAKVILTVGHLNSDLTWAPPVETMRVLLWHAIPLKAVGFKSKPVPDPVGNYDYVIATSAFTSNIMKEAFATERTKMIITGQPKTDPLFGSPSGKAAGKFKLNSDTRVVTYLPTWRHDFSQVEGGDFKNNSKLLMDITKELSENRSFLAVLQKHNLVFLIKTHPWDNVKHEISSDRIISLAPGEAETQSLLCDSDLLVSDYSGALIDWIALAKPVISFSFDYADYWQNRGSSAFDYQEVFKDIMIGDIEGLANEIDQYMSKPGYKHDILGSLAKLFHEHRDNRSSERIIDHCLKTLQ